jgi:hypothetical protein
MLAVHCEQLGSCRVAAADIFVGLTAKVALRPHLAPAAAAAVATCA